MAKKSIKNSSSRKSSKKKKSSKSLTNILIFVIIIALVAFVAVKYLIPSSESNTNDPTANKAETTVISPTNTTVDNEKITDNPEVKGEDNDSQTEDLTKKVIGSWMSTKEGAFLDINDDFTFSIDYSDIAIEGTYGITGERITFVTTKGLCAGSNGEYSIKFEDDLLVLSCKTDKCESRKNYLDTKWKRIRIED